MEVDWNYCLVSVGFGIWKPNAVLSQCREIWNEPCVEQPVCDYFIVCNGTSNTQVAAIVNSIQKTVSKKLKDKPWHVEGMQNAEWVLMDYVNVVVHVFQKHIREYYDIESLWGDAKVTSIESNY